MYKSGSLSLEDKDIAPLEYPDFCLFAAPHISPRIQAQAGFFTIQDEPGKSLSEYEHEGRLIELHIPYHKRSEFRDLLAMFDINDSTMFPGLDGIANNLETLMKKGI